MLRIFLSLLAVAVPVPWLVGQTPQTDQPNVLFIAIDDLNDWTGCLSGHPQSRTPNLDRLAASGMLFTNAHAPGSACNSSRTAVMTGISPHVSGLYDNRQRMREVLPQVDIMPRYFSDHGYWSAGSGKILHYFIDAQSWDDYYPDRGAENPFPRTLYPDKRPLSLPRAGDWQYVETDWGPLQATDEQYGGDFLVSEWIGKQLRRKHDQPFFLACGIYRPHEPWFVPQKYFDKFPIETIKLPPGYKADDLDDLPPAGQETARNRYFAHIRKHKQWKQGIQGYLASIHFADAMLGKVIEALESGPNADNTIVVLWSDHGWHLGEKEHWQKYTGWRAGTRVPLIIRLPDSLHRQLGSRPGRICDRPVNLLSLFPTLLELAGLPSSKSHDGPSLVPLLQNPEGQWPHVSITHLSQPGSYAVSGQRYRLVHYANGDREFYDIVDDPYEWKNLALVPEFKQPMQRLRSRAPREFAPKPAPRVETHAILDWHPVATGSHPGSKPTGLPFPVEFENRRTNAVKLYWSNPRGELKFYANIKPDNRQNQSTRLGAVWVVTDQEDRILGHFRVDSRRGRAVIPR